jgi:hypothetical protein
MLDKFIKIYSAIQITLNISTFIKNKHEFMFNDTELKFLLNCQDILKIFIKSTIILQTKKYCFIQYVFSYIYQIFDKLNKKYQDVEIVSY